MKMHLFKSVKVNRGYVPIVSPANSELKHIEFGLLALPETGDRFVGETRGCEAVLTIFGGKCNIAAECPAQTASYETVGNRADVFSGKPTMLYLPRNARYEVVAEKPMFEAGISKAPCEHDYKPVLVKPEETIEKSVGASNWQRKVYTSIGDNVEAERLLVGETLNPPGNWSSSPPHKHDVKALNEAPLEEVYFFKVKPSQGFGIQRIYTSPDDDEPLDEAYVVENNDTVVIPRGYHPVVAAPGYSLYYLWILAGEERRYGAWSDDPRHSWIKNVPPKP